MDLQNQVRKLTCAAAAIAFGNAVRGEDYKAILACLPRVCDKLQIGCMSSSIDELDFPFIKELLWNWPEHIIHILMSFRQNEIKDHKIISANQVIAQETQYDIQEIIGKSCKMFCLEYYSVEGILTSSRKTYAEVCIATVNRSLRPIFGHIFGEAIKEKPSLQKSMKKLQDTEFYNGSFGHTEINKISIEASRNRTFIIHQLNITKDGDINIVSFILLPFFAQKNLRCVSLQAFTPLGMNVQEIEDEKYSPSDLMGIVWDETATGKSDEVTIQLPGAITIEHESLASGPRILAKRTANQPSPFQKNKKTINKYMKK